MKISALLSVFSLNMLPYVGLLDLLNCDRTFSQDWLLILVVSTCSLVQFNALTHFILNNSYSIGRAYLSFFFFFWYLHGVLPHSKGNASYQNFFIPRTLLDLWLKKRAVQSLPSHQVLINCEDHFKLVIVIVTFHRII